MKTEIKTKRLVLRPMTVEALDRKVLLMESGEERDAYMEMLAGCRSHPENWLWYTAWDICLKKGGTVVGDACFKGPQVKGSVELGYGMAKPYEGQGYMTEAANALVNWALAQPNVYAVEAETVPGNMASQHILEKLGFRPNGEGEEGPRFIKEKAAASMGPLYMCLGLSTGVAMGIVLGNIAVGMCLGTAGGYLLGMQLDNNGRKRREEITGKK